MTKFMILKSMNITETICLGKVFPETLCLGKMIPWCSYRETQRQRISLRVDVQFQACTKETDSAMAKAGKAIEINILVSECEICHPFLPSQGKQQIIPGTSATGPMTDVGSDLFQIGNNHYLMLVDRYSNFPFEEKLTKLSNTA